MAVENLGELSGLARLDAIQRGDSLEPIRIPEIVRAVVPTKPTKRERRDLKLTWQGIKELALTEVKEKS